MAIQVLSMRDEKVDIRKWLILGDPGTGKTTFLSTLPKPTLVFSCDLGYSSLRGMDGIDVIPLVDVDKNRPTAYQDFQAVFKGINKTYLHKGIDGKETPYQTIAIDGVGFFAQSVINYILYVNSMVDKPMQIQNWWQLKQILNQMVKDAVLKAEYVVVTCLMGIDKDELTGEILWLPSIMGSAKDDVPAWFDAVLYTTKTVDVNKVPKYQMIIVGDRTHKTKIRIPVGINAGLLPLEEPSFQVIYGKVEKAIAGKG